MLHQIWYSPILTKNDKNKSTENQQMLKILQSV